MSRHDWVPGGQPTGWARPDGSSRGGVVQIVQSIDRGGLEMMAVDLAIALQRRGIPSAVVALDYGGRLEEKLAEHGVPLHVVGNVHVASPASHLRLLRLLRRLRPQAVHTHALVPLLNVVAEARLAGIPNVVHTEHGFWYLETDARLRLALRVAARMVTSFTVVADRYVPFYEQVVGLPAGRVEVVVNGTDVEHFRPAADQRALRRRLGIPTDGRLVVGSVGRLDPEKNYSMLVRAAARARAVGAPVHLVLVGAGSEKAELEELVTRLELTDAVSFLGWRTDIRDIMAALDVFALTSQYEGLPLAVIEAMACGVPVVSTPVGDVPAILDEERCGLLSPLEDADAFGDALATLERDPARRAALGRAARARAAERYSHASMVDTYVAAYGLGAARPVDAAPSLMAGVG